MKGYKAFNNDLTCRNFQYEIGHTYEFDGKPVPCERGFHFCKSIAECYDYYETVDTTRICEIEATGDIKTDDEKKYCTNKITILREITDKWERRGNTSASSAAGYCNAGSYNTGNYNSGNYNSGSYNTGRFNTGDYSTGYSNTGDRNTGDYNSGDYNVGSFNTGNRNTGDYNSGDHNSGDHNTGNFNTGDYNAGSFNTGCFCVENHPVLFFDNESKISYSRDWLRSKARHLLNSIPRNTVEWIDTRDMSDDEKIKHPSYKTTGGYLKVLDESDSAQAWWDSLDEDNRKVIFDIPNFDADKFKKCTGIDVSQVAKEEDDGR